MPLPDHDRPFNELPGGLGRQGVKNDLQRVRCRHMGVTVAIDEFGLDAQVFGFGKKVHSARCLHGAVLGSLRICVDAGRG